MLSLIFPQYVYDFHPGSAHSGGIGSACIACKLLDCRKGGGEGKKKTWLESRQAGALLIIMSSLQVSQHTVGGGGGGVDNMRADKEKLVYF